MTYIQIVFLSGVFSWKNNGGSPWVLIIVINCEMFLAPFQILNTPSHAVASKWHIHPQLLLAPNKPFQIQSAPSQILNIPSQLQNTKYNIPNTPNFYLPHCAANLCNLLCKIFRLQNAGPSFVIYFSGQIGWNLEEAVDCNDLGIYTDRSRDQDIPRNSVRTFPNTSISLTACKGIVLWMWRGL